MSDCIFCKIANGEIPSATLYEDEDFRVILDLGPASKGHALILPKAHAANIYEISDDMAAKAMILAKKMATKMTEALKCDGFNIVQNNGEPAGQTVFHFHMHLIPRYKNDNVGLGWNVGTLTEEDKDLSKLLPHLLYRQHRHLFSRFLSALLLLQARLPHLSYIPRGLHVRSLSMYFPADIRPLYNGTCHRPHE